MKDVAGVRGRAWRGVALAPEGGACDGCDGSADRYGKSPRRARVGDFTEQSVDASQASQPDSDDPVEASEREAVRGEACGLLWPRCPTCARDDRPAGSAAGCRCCREFVEVHGPRESGWV